MSKLLKELVSRLLQDSRPEQVAVDRQAIEKAQIPFEVIMGEMSAHFDLSSLFLAGQQNANHRFVADLVARGWLKTVATTNFDVLLECALENAGLVRGLHFDVYASEQELKVFCNEPSARCAVLKIHGCADRPHTIRATVRSIATQCLLADRRAVLRHLFCEGPHRGVLVLGYSGSDAFDVNPFLTRVIAKRKNLLLVWHTPGPAFPQEHVFNTFPGWTLVQETKQFLAELRAALGLPADIWERAYVDWRAALERLLSILSEALKRLLVAQLLLRSHENRLALARFEEAAALAAADGDRTVEARALNGTAICLRLLRDLPRSICADQRALQLAPPEDLALLASIQRSLGHSYQALFQFPEALARYEEAERIARQADLTEELSILLSAAGLCARRLGELGKARHFYHEALALAQKTGNVEGLCGTHANLSAVESLDHDERAVEMHLRTSLKHAEALGDGLLVSQALHNLGSFHGDKRDWPAALAFFNRALELKRRYDGTPGLTLCLCNAAIAYRITGNRSRARSLAQEALDLAAPNDVSGRIHATVVLAWVLAEEGETQRAEALARGAIPIARKHGLVLEEIKAWEALGVVFLERGGVALPEACSALDTADQLAREHGMVAPRLTILEYLADCCSRLKNKKKRKRTLSELKSLRRGTRR